MPNRTDQLNVAAWALDQSASQIGLTRFMLPEAIYGTLAQWAPKARNLSLPAYPAAVLSGLSEILAFFAPEIAYVNSRERYPSKQAGLALYMLTEKSSDGVVRTHIADAINFWLTILYPDKPAEMRMAIAASARDERNWQSVSVSTSLKAHAGVCAVPNETALFSALTATAVVKLSGTRILFGSGDTRTLIAQTPQSSTFNGVELVAFPPKREPDGSGLYTEVVNLRMATFAERKEHGLHLLAQPSIRNWGPIKHFDLSGSPARSLDLVMPSRNGEPSEFETYKHSRLMFKARVVNWDEVHQKKEEKRIEAEWESRRNQNLFDVVRGLVGAPSLSNADLLDPVIDHEGVWILPRLAPGSGDRRLAGGSGIGWPDRNDIAASLDTPLGEIGFTRCGPMMRARRTMAIKSPYTTGRSQGIKQPERRAFLRKALAPYSKSQRLKILVLHIRDETPAIVDTQIVKLFGEPDERDGGSWSWADGLYIDVICAPAGPFAQLLPKAEISSQELEGMSDAQAAKIRDSRQRKLNKNTASEMSTYLRLHLGPLGDVGCAIVEMHESLMGEILDPYMTGRQVLAEHNLLPKVVLFKEQDSDEKYRSSMEDCLRMLGVVPFAEDQLQIRPAAIGVIQRNQTGTGNSAITAQSVPVAVRLRDGLMEGALPNSVMEPEWRPYALIVLDILQGSYERLTRRQTQENRALFGQFVRRALEHLDQSGDTLVMLDGAKLRASIPGLQNSALAFDYFDLGQRTYRPYDLPHLRLARINTNSEELPSYSHTDATQWTQGLFKWDEASRTVYGVKKKPVTVGKNSSSLLKSRHNDSADSPRADGDHRKAASLDEICMMFVQAGDQIESLQFVTHRLRSQHVNYSGDTRLPFPLHELIVLSKAITS